MRKNSLLVSLSTLVLFTSACAPSSSGPESATPQSPPQVASSQVHADLAQFMRGVLFPNSNVIFAAQGTNPAEVKQASDPSTATDPIASVYGGWMAVENSGLALAESANLLMVAGRTCQNGKPIPMQNPDWAPMVQELRDAGLTAYKAARSKNQDNILAAADKLATACMNCHEKYREKPDDERCM